MTRDPRRMSDGSLSLEGGVDSGRTPNLVGRNQDSFAVNTTYRGGWPMPRPGWRKRILNWQGQEEAESGFKQSLFQVAGGYVADSGDGSLISMQGGRQFRINLSNFTAQEITIPGDPNPSNRQRAWSVQAENFFLIQDGQSKAFIYNGSSSRRATETEVPVGMQMAYYMGRIWVARGRQYVAGDIVFGPPGYNRGSILNFTENDYLNEGGAFLVPAQFGDITALKPIASINTALGQGELVVFTRNGVFATTVPQNRDEWKNTTQPLQRIIQLQNGTFCQDSVVQVNEDLFYRARDGERSLAYSVRNQGQWGNRPQSNEVTRILSQDAEEFLEFGSGVLFDNRLLQTSSVGIVQGRGVFHRCFASLDFDLITSMRETFQPAWEGIYTGLRILKVVTVEHIGVERCFMYVLNATDDIELWEATKSDKSDNNGAEDVRIEWSQESRSMDFGTKFEAKRLDSGDLFHDRISGDVEFTIEYRPDSHPCWIPWDSWSECSKTSLCADEFGSCPTLKNFQEQYRPKHQLTTPPDTTDPILKKMYRVGYEIQIRRTIRGFARVKQLRINAYSEQELPYGGQL